MGLEATHLIASMRGITHPRPDQTYPPSLSLTPSPSPLLPRPFSLTLTLTLTLALLQVVLPSFLGTEPEEIEQRLEDFYLIILRRAGSDEGDQPPPLPEGIGAVQL